jgi:hypothetical protein
MHSSPENISLMQYSSDCGPWLFDRRSAGGFERKALQELYQTLNERKIHPYMSVKKLPLLDNLQQKVGELVLSINFCPSVIILDNTLN